jgi:hypothetical protein
MLAIVAFGLLVSGVTIWPAAWELRTGIRLVWGGGEPAGVLHAFVAQALDAYERVRIEQPFLLYGYDWLAFAHIVLAILFAGAARDPVRNIWVIQCGLVMCALVPVLAGVCIPLRGIPAEWFWIDFAFAPAAALPLWIALRDVRRIELRAGGAAREGIAHAG